MAARGNKMIGFIGLGNMGLPMLENLIEKLPDSTKFCIFDVSSAVLGQTASKYPSKVEATSSSAEVAKKADVVFSMVPEGSHVQSVYLTPETGVLATDCSGKLLVDCSTIDTATVLRVGAEVQRSYPSASFYDAPVSGGVSGAKNATLTFMIGCKESDPRLPDLEYLLGTMGTTLVPCGGLSLGVTAKLCHNFCSALIAIATSEAMNIGIKAGMDPRVIKNVFSSSLAQSTILDKWCPCPGLVPDCPASHGYKPGFRIELMQKDFKLAVDTAKRVGAKLAIGQAGLDCYTNAMNDPSCKGLDSRVVYRYIGGDENWDGKQAEREAWRRP